LRTWEFLLVVAAIAFGGVFVLVAATIAERRERKKHGRRAR
jgi:hypothetical protein